EYYIAEITKKLLNPAYAIVKKAVKQEFALPELKPLKQITIEPVQFKTDDQLAQIVSIIKEKINTADEYYKQKKYKEAIEVYNDIITRIETKLSGERKQKLLGIKDDVIKHRDMIYAAIYSERITQIDEQYKALKEGDVKQINKIMQAYETIEEELSRIPDSEWLFQKQEIVKTVQQRKIALYEVMGQIAFKQYDFTTAYDMMRKAFDIGKTIPDDKNNYNIYYGEKLVIIRGTAENYITSRLQSLISLAEYYNFNDDTANAKKALNQAYSLLTGKQKPYVTQDAVEKYNTAAEVIGGTIITDKDIQFSIVLGILVKLDYTNQKTVLKGIPVMDVVPESAAYNAGLQRNDVIVAINTTPVSTLEDMSVVLKKCQAGTEQIIKVLRNNTVYFVPITGIEGKLLDSNQNYEHLLCIATLGRHDDDVLSVAFSPNGELLASGSLDNTVKLWNIIDKTCIATLKGHEKDVKSVAFSPDGKLLASGSRDKTIKLWNVAGKTCIATLAGHEEEVYSVAFSPDGKLLASGSADNTIKLWERVVGF
ncbi:MAG: PDZ domain-containing protein, partial [Spirochaetota bacterium]